MQTSDTKNVLRKPNHQQNIYYDILPIIISVLALFGAFKFFSLLTPILKNLLKVINCFLKNYCSTKKCKQNFKVNNA